LLLCVGGLEILRRQNVFGPDWSQFIRVAPAALLMGAVLLPASAADASPVVLAGLALLSLPAYFAAAIWSGALPWADVTQVRAAVARHGLIRRRARCETQSEASTELAAPTCIDKEVCQV
jgi:hypothetical protein